MSLRIGAAGVVFGLASAVTALAGLEALTPLLTTVVVAPVSAAFDQLRGAGRPER